MSESKKSYEGVKVLKVRTSYEHSYELPDRITVSLWSRRGLDDRTTVVSNPPRIRLIWALLSKRSKERTRRESIRAQEPGTVYVSRRVAGDGGRRGVRWGR